MSDQTFGKDARKSWDEMNRKQDTADNAETGDYVCGDCDRVERDPMFLDLETCSKCGELIEAVS